MKVLSIWDAADATHSLISKVKKKIEKKKVVFVLSSLEAVVLGPHHLVLFFGLWQDFVTWDMEFILKSACLCVCMCVLGVCVYMYNTHTSTGWCKL